MPTPPTPTPIPLAALVNGVGISLAEYQAELARYQAAVRSPDGAQAEPSAQEGRRVLDDLIAQTLLAQAAAENGFTVDDATLQAHLDQLVEKIGGEAALAEWMATNYYDPASLGDALRRSIAAAWKRDQIVAGVPLAAEQVHARRILFNSADEANQALAQLLAGADFEEMALKNDPLTAGELGWFPRGYLLETELEEAAFNLQPGQFSAVLQVAQGEGNAGQNPPIIRYNILQVIERQAERPLDPDPLLVLQEKALISWLDVRRSQSDIQTRLSFPPEPGTGTLP